MEGNIEREKEGEGGDGKTEGEDGETEGEERETRGEIEIFMERRGD